MAFHSARNELLVVHALGAIDTGLLLPLGRYVGSYWWIVSLVPVVAAAGGCLYLTRPWKKEPPP